MSHNTFGHMFRVTTWGESHGVMIGCVIDGCPPGLTLRLRDIQSLLDKRRPGRSRFTSQRREADKVELLSGVLPKRGSSDSYVTTGAPISMTIQNKDVRSKDYSDISGSYRPGHADYTYDSKYGIRDYRGGGRSSARETAMRVAAGAVARVVIPGVKIRGALVQLGPHKIDRNRWSWPQVSRNEFFCPDSRAAKDWSDYLMDIRKSGDSVGAVIEVIAEGVPVGWGAPLYGKLDQDIASGLMSINAVKGVEIGAGMGAASLRGSENADEMRATSKKSKKSKKTGQPKNPKFLSNNSGGVLGGISTGQPIVARFAVKPTSSILIPKRTITKTGKNTDIITKGRHDPCVGIRAVPIGEAMVACVLADHFLRHRAQTGTG